MSPSTSAPRISAMMRSVPIHQGDLDAAREFVSAMGDALGRHWKGEENGLFRVMAAREQDYADYLAPLIVEHRELA